MPTSNIHSNATIINIQSPDDSPEMNQPSLNSQQPLAKPSPKVEEYKKIIQHIMGKIHKRKRPSSSVLYLQPVDQFENDETIDLLIKLRSALMTSRFNNKISRVRTPNATPVSSKVNSPLPSPRIGSPSRSPENIGSILPSIIQPKNDKRSEFEKILSVLSDLISNDSRYKTANPKPSVPPFIMQSVLIDIGLIIIQMQEDTMSLYSIGLTYMPAFEAFSNGPMLGKLMSLYLDSLLPKIIQQKDIPNDTKKVPEKTHLTVHQKQNTPTISIQSPDHSNSLKMSHLTIDTQIPTTDSNTNSPYISNQADTHHTFALFTPLLFFMIEYLDPYLSHPEKTSLDFTMTQQADSIHNFHRALGFMMLHKPDIYLDLLDIISHSTHAVKYRACQVLFFYYPTSTGHALITNTVSLLSTQEEIEALDKYRNEQEPVDLEEDHVWYPHLFESPTTCKECFDTIEGFGLCCYPCKVGVHYHCSQANFKEQSLLYYLKPGGMQKVIMPHFCSLRPEPRFKDRVYLGDTDWTATSNAAHVPWGDHQFDLVNLHTLMNCTHCRLPLCGISQQAYHCSLCQQFIHPQCLAKQKDKWACRPGDFLTEEELKTTSSILAKSLNDFYKDALPLKSQDLQGRSFEEVSTILNVLLIQDNIIHCGVSAGSIMIRDPEEAASAHPFDTGSFHLISQAVKLCLEYLSQSKTFFSSYKPFQCLLSQDNYLGHLGAMMKSLKTTLFGNGSPTGYMSPGLDTRRSVGDSRGFLQVNPVPCLSWEDEEESFDEHVHEQIDRSLLLSWMMTNMGFKSRKATEMLLQHMRNIGLFERADGSPVVFGTEEVSLTIQEEGRPIACLFPIPFAIHASYTVNSTINAIEACLSDVDLSINECGFLLLVRRCWPNSLMSTYAHERLIRAILQWVFDEDDRLLALHAELMSNKGTNQKQTKWAQTAFARKAKGQARQSVMFQTAGVSSGASSIYVGTRHALKQQYIALWMAAVHDMDEQAYSDMLYTAIEEILESKSELCVVPEWNENFDQKKHTIQKYERFVSFILKLKSYDLVFSVLDFLIQKWFNQAYEDFNRLGFLKDNEPAEIKHLAKLCSTKLNIHQTHEPGSAIDILLAQIRNGNKDGIDRGMRWLELVVYAGAGVPSKILAQIAKMITAVNASMEATSKFIKIVWFQIVNVLNAPLAQKDIVDMLGTLHKSTLDGMSSYLEISSYQAHDYIKYSVAVLAYVFGCSLEKISKLDIVPDISHKENNIPANKRNTLHSINTTTIQPDDKLPIFDCMLKYLNYKPLGEYVVKLFYALSQWGAINKDELLLKCMDRLIPVVWDNLVPSFDYLSNINLDLLMKIVRANHTEFQLHVYKQFKDDCWEIRYRALDNLYGFFSKMDVEFQTVWLNLLCHLGPIFTYFIESLWDKEEYVRSKAFALIRSFNTLHLRSAFRCLEAYFLTANEEQRVPLIRQMIELNSLFPDWQVLQWESLLEALEAGSYADIIEEHAHPLGYDASKNQTTKTIEQSNMKLHMITLAMQMLSNNLNMTHDQVYRLKFVLVQQMGFQNCHYFHESGEIMIELGVLVYDSTKVAQTASMMVCIRGLRKVMDSFAPLPAEAIAAMASQSVEQKLHLSDNTSPGIYFIDVVFKMMNSGVDLSQLGHMVLRAWLETYLIVIYKHNILDPEHERDIVSSMKSVIELLNSDISEENKLLVLEILKCLLRRSDHLTAMVLSKQILALGKLLTQHELRHSDPVMLKAKQFLKSAFLRFAVAGLFVLLFKNQENRESMDLFFVLRTVIDPEDTIPDEDIHGEPIYLYDQPVRDVLDKLMKQQMDRKSFSNVIYNTSRYIQTVHSHPYSLSVLHELPNFLNTLIKHTADWRRSDWDINPALVFSAILLKEHPYQYSTLLLPIQAVLKHGLQHCQVQAKTAALLLAAYASVAAIPNAPKNNIFVDILLEETKSYLTLSNRPNKETMQMLLELILWNVKPMGQSWYAKIDAGHAHYFDKKLEPMLAPLVHFLKLSSNSQQFTKKDFKVYTIASHLVVYQCSKDSEQVTQVIGMLKLEETPECLRFLNWFVLILLSEGIDVLLLKMLDYETMVVDLLVQTLNNVKIDYQHPDPNFLYNRSNEVLLLCFILIRTWALLKLRCNSIGDLQDVNQSSFWFSIWPSLRRMMEKIETASLFMTGNVGVPIWDMFLSLLQFLFVSRSEAVVINAYEWCIILEDLLEKLEEIGNHELIKREQDAEQIVSMANFKRRIVRIKSMFEVPPLELPERTLINQLLLELRDIMRLEVESVTLQGNSRTLTNAIL